MLTSHPANENTPPAEGAVPVPTAEKEPNVSPVAVGGGVGSVGPVVDVTLEKGYIPLNACEKTLRLKNKSDADSKFLIMIKYFWYSKCSKKSL